MSVQRRRDSKRRRRGDNGARRLEPAEKTTDVTSERGCADAGMRLFQARVDMTARTMTVEVATLFVVLLLADATSAVPVSHGDSFAELEDVQVGVDHTDDVARTCPAKVFRDYDSNLFDHERTEQLEDNPLQWCKQFRGNETRTWIPNILNHYSQREMIESFKSLDRLDGGNASCSPSLRHFLCLVHFPFPVQTGNVESLVVPCRALCEDVRSSCSDRMSTLGITWWESVRCENMPVTSDPCWVGNGKNASHDHQTRKYQPCVGIRSQPTKVVVLDKKQESCTTVPLPDRCSSESHAPGQGKFARKLG